MAEDPPDWRHPTDGSAAQILDIWGGTRRTCPLLACLSSLHSRAAFKRTMLSLGMGTIGVMEGKCQLQYLEIMENVYASIKG